MRAGNIPGQVMHHHRVFQRPSDRPRSGGWCQERRPERHASAGTGQALTILRPRAASESSSQAAAQSRTPEMSTLITLAALTGMRRGELAGLRWTDIDWQGSSLTVHRSVWQTNDGWGTK